MLVLLAFTTGCDALAGTPPPADPIQATATAVPPACHELQVVYIKNSTVWLWSENGSIVQLGSAGKVTQVKISPDCQWVAYLQDDQLLLTGIKTVNPEVVVPKTYLDALARMGGRILQFDFSPDSQTIYFLVAYSEDYSGLDLFKIEMTTKMPVRLIGPGLGGNYTVSPDSKCMTIVRANQLDLYCKGDSQSSRVLEFPNDCSIGAHTGLDIQWAKDSSGFFVVTPQCNDNSENGHLVFQQVPLARIADIAAGTYQPVVYEFLGKPSDRVDIAPDGKCLIHQEDTPDLRNLHVVCLTESTAHFSDNIYVSYPKDKLDFFGWSPDSQYFVISMPAIGGSSGSKVYYADPANMVQPLLSEQVQANVEPNIQATDIRWVNKDLFLFIYNNTGLCKEPFQKSGQVTPMTQIDNGPIDRDPGGYYEYDFAPPPQP